MNIQLGCCIFNQILEIQEFVIDQHYQQLERSLVSHQFDSADMKFVFVRRCVRRQVETAFYLPLRRIVLPMITKVLSTQASSLTASMDVIQLLAPHRFHNPSDLRIYIFLVDLEFHHLWIDHQNYHHV